jgi:carbon-monoxide dehydrogenase medium subunit
MITHAFEYSKPTTLNDALNALADGSAKPLAGGMSLIPMMKLRLAAPEKLIDLSAVPGLAGVSESGGVLRVGAMTTHFEIETSPILRGKCPLIAETASSIGDVQIRNVGTIGGAAAHADPSADYPAALLALEAKVLIISKTGSRTIDVHHLFVDALTNSLEPGELIHQLHLPIDGSDTGTCYRKVTQLASGYAMVGIAVRVRKTAGRISFARVAVTGLSSKAFRATSVEEALLAGKTPADAAALVTNGVDANADIHASADYRKHIARVTTARTITAALARIA